MHFSQHFFSLVNFADYYVLFQKIHHYDGLDSIRLVLVIATVNVEDAIAYAKSLSGNDAKIVDQIVRKQIATTKLTQLLQGQLVKATDENLGDILTSLKNISKYVEEYVKQEHLCHRDKTAYNQHTLPSDYDIKVEHINKDFITTLTIVRESVIRIFLALIIRIHTNLHHFIKCFRFASLYTCNFVKVFPLDLFLFFLIIIDSNFHILRKTVNR